MNESIIEKVRKLRALTESGNVHEAAREVATMRGMAGNPKKSEWYSTPATARKRKPTNVTLSEEAKARLVKLAEKHGVSQSEMIEALIMASPLHGLAAPLKEQHAQSRQRSGSPRPVYSPRGLPVLLGTRFGEFTKPVLTVEAYCKWYGLVLIGDGQTREVDFGQLEGFEDGTGFAAYYDHVPNPHAVRRFAEAKGWHLDDLAYELMTGRWALEVLP